MKPIYALKSVTHDKYWTGGFLGTGHFTLTHNLDEAYTTSTVALLIQHLINEVNDNHHEHSLVNWQMDIVKLSEEIRTTTIRRVLGNLG